MSTTARSRGAAPARKSTPAPPQDRGVSVSPWTISVVLVAAMIGMSAALVFGAGFVALLVAILLAAMSAALVSPPDSEPRPTHYKPGGYMKSVRNDPWGNPYQYVSPGMRSEFDLFSFGSDGQSGGDGAAADIGNWDH